MSRTRRLFSIDDMLQPKLLGPYFEGPSWARWKSVLKATFGEPMTDAELTLFKEVAGDRSPPKHRVSQAIYAVGRGGGKGAVASLMTTTCAVNFTGRLRPGEHAVVLCLAVDKDQASIVRNYIAAYFEQVPALKQHVHNIERGIITLKNRVQIIVSANSFRGVRGKSLLCVVCDEVAFWRDENSANPDVEIAAAVAPGLARVQGSMFVLISSTYRKSGLLYSRIRDHYGQNSDDALAIVGSTTQFNPTFDQSIIDRQITEDGPRFRAEYLSEWRDDLALFIGRELIEASVDTGVAVRPPQPGITYHCFIDASGGRSDSFTGAVAHAGADGIVFLDAVAEHQPPFNPTNVAAELTALAKSYRCNKIIGDNFGAGLTEDLFSRAGAKYERSERNRDQIYLDCPSLFSSGRLRLLDNKRLVSQFASLERRTFPTGREVVRKAPGSHDDLCNAAAGALTLAAVRSKGFNVDVLLNNPRLYSPGVSSRHFDPRAMERRRLNASAAIRRAGLR